MHKIILPILMFFSISTFANTARMSGRPASTAEIVTLVSHCPKEFDLLVDSKAGLDIKDVDVQSSVDSGEYTVRYSTQVSGYPTYTKVHTVDLVVTTIPADADIVKDDHVNFSCQLKFYR